MKIILEFDTLTDYHLNYLRIYSDTGWQSAEDILRPLIAKEFQRVHDLNKTKKST